MERCVSVNGEWLSLSEATSCFLCRVFCCVFSFFTATPRQDGVDGLDDVTTNSILDELTDADCKLSPAPRQNVLMPVAPPQPPTPTTTYAEQ